MIVKEMLDQVNAMVPNDLSASIKITFMNQVQNQLFRDYPFPEAIYPFTTTPGTRTYALPGDCPDSGIKKAVINGMTYDYISADTDIDLPRFCTILLGALVIEPVPDTSVLGLLHYKARPKQLTTDDLEMVPNFPSDFHELLVLGCAVRVARANDQLNLASVLSDDFLRIADKADRVLTKTKPKQVNMVRGWY